MADVPSDQRNSGSADVPSPLEYIVDDTEARQQSRSWAFDMLRAGQSPEWVEGELRSSGWSADDAAEMAEEARRRTRHMRGVVTRDDIATASDRAYHRGGQAVDLNGEIASPVPFAEGSFQQADAMRERSGAADGDGILPYQSQPSAREMRRARQIAIRAWVTTLIGGGLALLGLFVAYAAWASSMGESLRMYVFAGFLIVGGALMLWSGISDMSSPARLVARRDRGLLDRGSPRARQRIGNSD